MAWDSSRPIPWDRLMREWVIYAGIMGAVFLLFFRNGNTVGALAGLLVSGPLYLAFGAVLARLGYQRKTLAEMRTPRATADRPSKDSATPGGRQRPAPTSRTATGPNRAGSRKRRR